MIERRRVVPLALLLFVIGLAALARFAPHVRTVDAVGLSGGGCAIGVGFALLVLGRSGLARR